MQRVAHPPRVSEQIVVGFVTALVVAIADVLLSSAGMTGEAVPGDWALAGLHLIAMELPLGMALGITAGLVLRALHGAPGAEQWRYRFHSLRRIFHRNPDGFASGLGFLTAAGAFILAVRLGAEHFATRYHDPALAAWAMALVTIGLAAAALVVGILVAGLLRPVARGLGPLASVGSVLALALLGVAIVSGVVALTAPRLFRTYDPVAVAWGPGAAVVYLLVAIAVRRLSVTRGPRSGPMLAAGLACVAVTASLLTWSASSYGHSNVIRGLVERHTVVGLRLVRGYMRATDRDGDGHSVAFGGRDCDDTNANVHPGAVDEPGDGIDADCFAGDGTPDVRAHARGAYGTVPRGLDRPNILLVTIDALRADHLGSYGYDRPTSPELDALAKESVRFEHVVAQSSRSLRSVPALMTGLHPSQIAYGGEYLFPALLPENVTLAEALDRTGYETTVVMGTDYFERVAHFFQGFNTVDQIDRYRPPRRLPVDRALRHLPRLAKGDRPWFLWVHLFNVHEEYLWDRVPSKFGDRLIDAYDTEITFADREVGRLLDALREQGLADDTVVAMTSDHGEAFGEHGQRGHSRTVYEEELRVPLLIRVPGLAPSVVSRRVALFDLMPTLLNLADDTPVPRPMPARSLLPLMTGQAEHPEDRLLISEILPDGLYPYDQKAIRRGDMKLIWWVREGTVQLYDLSEDPGERRDLSDERPKLARELLGLLRAWVAQTNLPEHVHQDVVKRNRLDAPPAEMTRRLDARFPGFTVLGFDMPKTELEPGEHIRMTFYYRVESPIEDNLFFFVDIKGPPGYRVPPHFHAHHYPMNGRYRTYEWTTGEILRDPVEMIVPEDIRHPVTLRIDLAVRDDRRRFLGFEMDGGRGGRVLDLAEVRIR